MIPSPRCQASFLAQFALSTLKGGFSPVAASGRDFAQPSANRMAILGKHRNSAILIKRYYSAGAGMTNHGQVESDTVREFGTLNAEVNHSQL
jgi:hypothetical protein